MIHTATRILKSSSLPKSPERLRPCGTIRRHFASPIVLFAGEMPQSAQLKQGQHKKHVDFATNHRSISTSSGYIRFTATAFLVILGRTWTSPISHIGTTAFTTNMNIGKSTSSTSASSSLTSPNPNLLSKVSDNFDYSWLSSLSAETEENRLKSKRVSPEDDGISNNVKRPVYNGHYVLVKPTPLTDPRLVIHSPDTADKLGLTFSDVQTETFAKFFSGDTSVLEGTQSWATPYALSIMGKLYTSNCPFGTGDGYGDGRAISIAEVKIPSASSSHPDKRWELQLKGAGRTPFCRGADGRAVLRSSIREFLASEAMYHLGVDTTRALSLVVSEGGDVSQRPWYSDRNIKGPLPDMDDPSLASYSLEQRKQIISQLNAQSKSDPDMMIEETNAITCRVSKSFSRVGHFDLFARRVNNMTTGKEGKPDITTNEFKELEDLFWHVCSVEYPDSCYRPYKGNIISASKCLLEFSMHGIATMVANWIRVGFAQGNFNGDNCLVAGRTVDYGPFGFMDEYHPLFAKWTGSGDHFGFMNQSNAGYANFAVLVSSIMPIVRAYSGNMDEAKTFQDEIMKKAQVVFDEKLIAVLRTKMGFQPSDSSPDELWADLEAILRETRADWTLFWRQLTTVAKVFPLRREKDGSGKFTSIDYGGMLQTLQGDENKDGPSPFYVPLDVESKTKLLKWIQSWREALIESYKENELSTSSDYIAPDERMRLANPKYVLREWMLVEAYSKASLSNSQSSSIFKTTSTQTQSDESVIHELFELIQSPYDEGTEDQNKKYYHRAPDTATVAGGSAFMS